MSHVLAGKSSGKFFDQTNQPVHGHQAIGGHHWPDFHLSSGKLPGMTNYHQQEMMIV